MATRNRTLDILVVGAGQAGLTLLTWVGDDALYLTKHMLHHLERGNTSIDATRDRTGV